MLQVLVLLDMGQQIFLEENEKILSSSNLNLSPESEKSIINIAFDIMNIESQNKCCCKQSLSEFQVVGTDTCGHVDNVPTMMMQSVSFDTTDLPSMSLFSVYDASTNLISRTAVGDELYDKNYLNSCSLGCPDEFSSQSCVQNESLRIHNHPHSSCQLESAGLNCTFPTNLDHSFTNSARNCSPHQNPHGTNVNPDQYDSCDMTLIKNYISDLDEDFEEYSPSDCEERNSRDYNLAELSTVTEESNSFIEPKSYIPVSEKLTINFKGFTVATSNVNVLMHGNLREYHCCECDNIFNERHLMISHLESHIGFQPFQCVVCNELTSSEAAACAHYNIHFQDEHTGKGTICPEKQITGKIDTHVIAAVVYPHEEKSSSFASVSAHRVDKDSSSEFCCSVCNINFTSRTDLESHMNLHATPSAGKGTVKPRRKQKTVGQNNPSSKGRSKQGKFSKVQTTRKWSCKDCKKAFHTSKALREHEVVHTGARDFPCDICGKAFGTSANMRIHRMTHFDVRPFSCQICGANFRQKDSLKVHARKHTGERPYVCDVCKMTFDRSFTLKNHMLTHVQMKLFVCSVCGKTFSTRGGLNNHERLHFKNPEKPKKERGPRAKPGTGEWGCTECGKTYSTRSNLKMHQRTHEPSQVCHVCPICAKVYKSRDSLEVHKRRHSEDRPYKCPMCSRSFFRNYTLKLHMLTHTGEKPHQCPIEGCDKSFAQTSSLSYHVRNHKKQEERSEKKVHNNQDSKKQTVTQHFHSENLSTNSVGNSETVSLPVSENCAQLDEAQVDIQKDLKMLPNNVIGSMDFGNSPNENCIMQPSITLSSDVNHHLGLMSAVGWEDNVSVMGLINDVNETQPLHPLPHLSSLKNAHQQHYSPVELMPLTLTETLPLLVEMPNSGLYIHGSERPIGGQALLLQHLS